MNIVIIVTLLILSFFSLFTIAWVNLIEDETKAKIKGRFKKKKRDIKKEDVQSGEDKKNKNDEENIKSSKKSWGIGNFFWKLLKSTLVLVIIVVVIGLVLAVFFADEMNWKGLSSEKEVPLSYREQVLSDPNFAFAEPFLKECVGGCKIAVATTIKAGDIEEFLLEYPTYKYADFIVSQDVDIVHKDSVDSKDVDRMYSAKNADLCGKDIRVRRSGEGAIFARPVDVSKDTYVIVVTFPLGHYLCK